jgi:hypothetical protein
VTDASAGGLSSQDAARRLLKDGANAMPNTSLHPLQRALHKFEAAIIAALLAFNAAWDCSRRVERRRRLPR